MPSNTGDRPTHLTLSAATHEALKQEASLTDDTMSNIADKAIKTYLDTKANPICNFLSRFFSHA